MLTFIVCDDNEVLRKEVENIINNFMMKNDCAYNIKSYSDYDNNFMNELADYNSFKVYVLDIETPTKSGIDIARKIRNFDKESAIIFLTGHDEYGYTVLKSCTNFLTFISKFDDYEKNLENALKNSLEMLKVKKALVFQDHNVSYSIIFKSILYITKDTVTRKTIIVTDSNKYKIYLSLPDLKLKLPTTFKQCHRACVVNTDRIENINRNKNVITFDNGICIDLLSDKYKKELSTCG